MRVLLWLWSLPWPAGARRFFGRIATIEWLQRVLVPRFHVGVVGLIQNERGEFLLLRHTYRTRYPWGLPTGFLEPGEQPADALAREIREEVGSSIELDALHEVYVDGVRPLLNIVYRGTYRSGSFTPNAEVSAAQFFPAEQLPSLIPDQRRLIESHRSQEARHNTTDGVSSELL